MKYWQNEETGMCCAVESQPSPRHIEVSKEFYDMHERGLTPLALDAAKPALKTNFTKQDVLNAIEVIFNTPRK